MGEARGLSNFCHKFFLRVLLERSISKVVMGLRSEADILLWGLFKRC